MKRCSRCIMPETVPGVSFQDGICNFCRNYKQEQYLGEEALARVVNEAKGKGGRYDCLVPISGGRDSSYVLYLAKAVYGLKTLAVCYDNEFQTTQAVANLHRACQELDTDLLHIRSKRDVARKIVRSQIRLALAMKSPSIDDGLCIACSYGYRSVVYRAAKKYRVPLILWGESQAESTHWMMDTVERARQQQAKTRGRVGRLLSLAYCRVILLQMSQRLEFHSSGNSILRDHPPRLNDSQVSEIRVFDYLRWDRQRIKETIARELGWNKPAESTSTWRIDCKLTPLVNNCYFKRFGCSKACFGYCNMINSGQMSRTEALQQEEQIALTCHGELHKLLEHEVGLRKTEAAKVLGT